MQGPGGTGTGSTLELVVNEQQLQNMSQIDHDSGFSWRAIREWPARVCSGFSARLDEAKSKSETRTEYAFEVMKAFSGIVIWAVCLICTIIVPVLLFFVGLLNLDNCQDRPQLPYLVLGVGFVMSASNLFNLAMALDIPILTNHRLLSVDTKNTISSILNILFNCVVAFLYILTTFMVYTVGGRYTRRKPSSSSSNSSSEPNVEELPTAEDGDNPEPEEAYQVNCSHLLYHFTFWFITLTLCLFALLSLIAVALFAYNRYRLAIIRGSTPRSQQHQATNNNNNNLSTNPSASVANGTGSPFAAPTGTTNSRMI